jgi:hypothetical protein
MDMAKRCSDRTLAEMAGDFGIGSYTALNWSCRKIESKMAKEK